jgi:hypothetical protein
MFSSFKSLSAYKSLKLVFVESLGVFVTRMLINKDWVYMCVCVRTHTHTTLLFEEKNKFRNKYGGSDTSEHLLFHPLITLRKMD